ncbi:lysocardiolipin acyltransferase 1 [Stegostoma tigrinum]|uniref:lysocardiolipin acyltransferase 1 n=1 Tax=Stegostoma tigrinum TaxID=3053191 RepID=UPI002870514D|nr:lysocardiolipin acyltransferase 1 [Stegostoma tigrinum]
MLNLCPSIPQITALSGCNLDAIHDVTVAYPYNIPQSERDLFTGNFPREIHFHIRRYPADQLPTSIDGLKEWCCLRWFEKEKLLRAYYQGSHSFSDLIPTSSPVPEQSPVQEESPVQEQSPSRHEVPRKVPIWGRGYVQSKGQSRVLLHSSALSWSRRQEQVSGAQLRAPLPPCKSRGRVFLIKFFSIIYWTFFVIGIFVLIWSYTLARWYFASVAIFFIAQEKIAGGCEIMEVALHNRKPSQRWKQSCNHRE